MVKCVRLTLECVRVGSSVIRFTSLEAPFWKAYQSVLPWYPLVCSAHDSLVQHVANKTGGTVLVCIQAPIAVGQFHMRKCYSVTTTCED